MKKNDSIEAIPSQVAEQPTTPGEITPDMLSSGFNFDALDPLKNGTLATLKRIEQNTEAIKKGPSEVVVKVVQRNATTSKETNTSTASTTTANTTKTVVGRAKSERTAPYGGRSQYGLNGEAPTKPETPTTQASRMPARDKHGRFISKAESTQAEPTVTSTKSATQAAPKSAEQLPETPKPRSTREANPRAPKPVEAIPRPAVTTQPAPKETQAKPTKRKNAKQKEISQAVEVEVEQARPAKNPRQTTAETAESATAQARTERDKPRIRDSSGRFVSKAERALEEARQEKRDKSFIQAVRDGVSSGIDMLGTRTTSTEDALGNAVAGPIYGAAKEIKGAYDDLTNERTKTGQLLGKVFGSKEKPNATESTAETDTAKATEANVQATIAVEQKTETVAEAVTEQTKTQEKQHRETLDTLRNIRSSGGADSSTSPLDLLGERGNRPGTGKKPGLLRRTGSRIARLFGRGGAAAAGAAATAAGASGVIEEAANAAKAATGAESGAANAAGKAASGAEAGAAKAAGAAESATAQSASKAATGVESAAAPKGAATVSSAADDAAKAATGIADDAAKVGTGFLGKAAGIAGKALNWAAAPITGYLSYSDKAEQLATRTDLTDSQKTAQAVSTGIGSGGGALAGAAAGGATGAAIGSIVPGLGTAIGGIIGSVVGGVAGSWGGEKIGDAVGEAVSGTMDNIEEEAAKILENRDKAIQEAAAAQSEFSLMHPSTWFGGGVGGANGGGAPIPAGGGAPSGGKGMGEYKPDPSIITGDTLGRVSAKYESGRKGVTTISTGKGDAGGVSYGKHQLSSATGTMADFLKSKENAQYAQNFAGLTPGTEAFNAAYTKTATADPQGFADAQHAYIQRTHFNPVAAYAKAKGIDANDPAIQEALWSQSVQHSGKGNREIIDNAVAKAGKGASKEQVINALYDSRTAYASQFASGSATTERYANERKDVLAIAKSGGQQVAGANPPASPSMPATPAAPAAPATPPAAPAAPAAPVAPVAPVAQVAPTAPTATAAPVATSGAVVPVQQPEPMRQMSLQGAATGQPAPAIDSAAIGAQIAKAIAANTPPPQQSPASRGDNPTRSEDVKNKQNTTSTVPMGDDDTMMMLLAYDRI